MTTTLWVELIGGALLLGGGGYWLFLRSQRPKGEGEALHFNCPNCKQRLRYLPRQAGNAGQCPRCRRSLTFPGHPAAGSRRRPPPR